MILVIIPQQFCIFKIFENFNCLLRVAQRTLNSHVDFVNIAYDFAFTIGNIHLQKIIQRKRLFF